MGDQHRGTDLIVQSRHCIHSKSIRSSRSVGCLLAPPLFKSSGVSRELDPGIIVRPESDPETFKYPLFAGGTGTGRSGNGAVRGAPARTASVWLIENVSTVSL